MAWCRSSVSVCVAFHLVVAAFGAQSAGLAQAGKTPSIEELKVYAAAMTPDTAVMVAPVANSVAKVRAEQAALPLPQSLSERLLRLGALDQAPRMAASQVALSTLAPDQRKAGSSAIGAAIAEVDRENLATLLTLVPEEGWFRQTVVGKPAAVAAYRILQHADVATQAKFLPIFEHFVSVGEMDAGRYAATFDRVAIAQGRSQRFGSQMRCEAGHWVALPVEDPAGLDQRRQAMNLEPMSAYVKSFSEMRC